MAAARIGSISRAAWKAWRIFRLAISPSLWLGTAVIQPYGLAGCGAAGGGHHLLGIDGAAVVRRAQRVEQRARGLLEIEHDRVGVLALDRLHVLPDGLPRGRQLAPVLE